MATPAPELVAVAEAFALPGPVTAIEPLGNGNVNDTYRVDTASGACFVLQRLNTAVFPQPELVMQNLEALCAHAEQHPLVEQRWEVPRLIANRHTGRPWLWAEGQFWRLQSFIEGAVTVEAITDREQARQVGRGLGLFHLLISDLPPERLADTLPGFHITPTYLAAYDQCLLCNTSGLGDREQWCAEFVENRRDLAAVLEDAKAAGLLQLRPIHGDPKINNLMLCAHTRIAVGLVDLDTVKPGLVHYDIGDCLRSGCNPAGEEANEIDCVRFDLDLCEALLEGYLSAARTFLSDSDLDHIYVSLRLLSFELGLRFLSDHLAGNVYFRTTHPNHNLDRALVQFRLTESIEAQEKQIREIVAKLR
jgi:Ser/Thr protein kinase RdoA (MazF antagonist)